MAQQFQHRTVRISDLDLEKTGPVLLPKERKELLPGPLSLFQNTANGANQPQQRSGGPKPNAVLPPARVAQAQQKADGFLGFPLPKVDYTPIQPHTLSSKVKRDDVLALQQKLLHKPTTAVGRTQQKIDGFLGFPLPGVDYSAPRALTDAERAQLSTPTWGSRTAGLLTSTAAGAGLLPVNTVNFGRNLAVKTAQERQTDRATMADYGAAIRADPKLLQDPAFMEEYLAAAEAADHPYSPTDALLGAGEVKQWGLTRGLQELRQTGQQELRKGLGTVGNMAADVATMGADLATTMGLSSASGVPFRMLRGIQQGGNVGQQVLDQGNSAGQAGDMAFGSGAITAAVEGIGGIGGRGGTGKLLSMLPAGIRGYLTKLSGNQLARILGTALEEAGEEALEYDLQRIYRNIILEEDTPRDVKEQAYNALMGGVVGGVFGAGRAVSDYLQGARRTADARITEPDEPFRYFDENIEDVQTLNEEYRRLAKENHPDLGGDTQTMTEINAERDRYLEMLEYAQQRGDKKLVQSIREKLHGLMERFQQMRSRGKTYGPSAAPTDVAPYVRPAQLTGEVARAVPSPAIGQAASIDTRPEPAPSLNSVAPVVDEVVRKYAPNVNEQAAVQGIQSLKTQAMNGTPVAEVERQARGLAEELLGNVGGQAPAPELQEAKRYLRTTAMSLSAADKPSVQGYDSFGELRKHNMGRLRLTNDGLPIDTVYMEFQRLHPGLVPEGLTHPADILNAFDELLQRSGMDDGSGQAAAELANELVERVYSDGIREAAQAEDAARGITPELRRVIRGVEWSAERNGIPVGEQFQQSIEVLRQAGREQDAQVLEQARDALAAPPGGGYNGGEEQSPVFQGGKAQEDGAAFQVRTTQSGGQLVPNGKGVAAVYPTHGASIRPAARAMLDRAGDAGLRCVVVDQPLEINRNGMTTRHGEATTLRDGTIYIWNGTEQPAPLVIDHEKMHAMDFLAPELYDQFYNIMGGNIDYSSAKYEETAISITKAYADETLEISPELFLNELVGNLAGEFALDPQGAKAEFSELFYDVNEVYAAWEAANAQFEILLKQRGGGGNDGRGRPQELPGAPGSQNRQENTAYYTGRKSGDTAQGPRIQTAGGRTAQTPEGIAGPGNQPGLDGGRGLTDGPRPLGADTHTPRPTADQLSEQYGNLPAGEFPAREAAIPRRSPEGPTSRFVRTVAEAGTVDDATVQAIRQEVAEGTYAYVPSSNRSANAYADDILAEKGYDGALKELTARFRQGEHMTKKDVALAMRLFQGLDQHGYGNQKLSMLGDLSLIFTEAGQTVQAASMFKRLTPEGRLMTLKRLADRQNAELEKRGVDALSLLEGEEIWEEPLPWETGDTNSPMTAKEDVTVQPGLPPVQRRKPIQLPKKVVEGLLKATDPDELDELTAAGIASIARQMPSTFMDKVDGWRYLAMLFNPRTWGKNLVGNAVFVPARQLKNLIALGLEQTSLKWPVGRRSFTPTKARLTAQDKPLRQYAAMDFETIRDYAMSSGRYNDTNTFQKERQIFDGRFFGYENAFTQTVSKGLEGARRFMGKVMDGGDLIFLKGAYADSFAQYMKANGVSVAELQELFPVEERLPRERRGLLDQTGWPWGDSKTTKANQGGPLSDSARKEQVRRLLNQAQDYALKEAWAATYRDASELADYLNEMRRNTKKPLLKVTLDSIVPFTKTPINVAKRSMEYSPAEILYTLVMNGRKVRSGEWSHADFIDGIAKGLTGTALLALGALLYKSGHLTASLSGNDKEQGYQKTLGQQEYAINVGDYSYTVDWASPTITPIMVGAELYRLFEEERGELQLSDFYRALGTITEPIFETTMMQGLTSSLTSFSQSASGRVGNLAETILSNYVGQFVPTIFGQTARSVDTTRRSTYGPESFMLTKGMQRTVRKQMAKVPGLSMALQPFIDQWGRVQKNNDGANLGAQLMLNMVSPGYLSKKNQTPVDEEILRLQKATGNTSVIPAYAPTVVSFGGQTYAMQPSEYTRYAMNRGQGSYRYIEKLLKNSDYKRLNSASRAEVIQDVYRYSDALAKKEFFQERGIAYQWSDWQEKAYLAQKEAGIPVEVYILLRNSTPDSTPTQAEYAETLRRVSLSQEQRRYLFNLRWPDSKKNPFK